MPEPQFIVEYLAAYAEANPNSKPPAVVYRGGWVEFRSPFLSRYRRRQIEEMTARLRFRALQESGQ